MNRQYVQAKPCAARELAQLLGNEAQRHALTEAANTVEQSTNPDGYAYFKLTDELSLRISKRGD